MRAKDVTGTLDMALAASGCDQASVKHKPRLLSDNGPSYIAGGLADYIEANRMSHVRGAPFHPQTQGKVERQKSYGASDAQEPNPAGELLLARRPRGPDRSVVEHYNHQRHHESLSNVTAPFSLLWVRTLNICFQQIRQDRIYFIHLC